jgi:YozE SAM-like fold
VKRRGEAQPHSPPSRRTAIRSPDNSTAGNLKMTFHEWLARRRVTDSPRGLLIADIRDDRSFPEDIASIYQLLGHLVRQRACPGATSAARALWAQYARAAGRPIW